MKYTQNLVWEAVYEVCPHYKMTHKHNIIYDLPEALKAAAVEFFMIDESIIKNSSTDYVFAKFVVGLALKELAAKGLIEFGDVNEYWM